MAESSKWNGDMMEDLYAMTANQWLGFATRTMFLHWIRLVGGISAALGGIILIPTSFGLLSVFDDLGHHRPIKDLELEAAMLAAGGGLLAVGSLLIMLDSLRQWREVARGKINAYGVFWNLATNEKVKGVFAFEIDSGIQIPDEPAGFKHTCKAMRHIAEPTSGPKSLQTVIPVLRMVFAIPGGLVRADFASQEFNKRSDLDTIAFVKGSMIRVNGKKADPCRLCTAIGTELKNQAPNMVDVQLVVHLNPNAAAPSAPSSAGVIGAGMFGAVGGAVGAVIEQKQEQRQKRESAAQQAAHEERVRKLFQRLEPVASEFGWTAEIKRSELK